MAKVTGAPAEEIAGVLTTDSVTPRLWLVISSRGDSLSLYAPSPEYRATIAETPAGRLPVVIDAVEGEPVETNPAGPSTVTAVGFSNYTLPVGLPESEAELTVAVNVICCPGLTEVAEEVRLVTLAAFDDRAETVVERVALATS